MTTAHRGLIGITGLLWALQGCFDPSPPAGVVCAPDGWCPSGQQCDVFTWQCFPPSGSIDGGTPWVDSGWPWPPVDASWPWPDGGGQRVGIDEALLSYGSVDILIPEVLVTYVKPESLYESAGFFVQGEQYGPALFVGVDPDLSGARLEVGDRVSFRIWEMGDTYGLPTAVYIDSVIVHGRNLDVSGLLQDVTEVGDFSYNAYLYAAELVTARVRIDGAFFSDDLGETQSARIDTSAVFGDEFLRLRVPNALQDTAGLGPDCTLRLPVTPVWRYYGQTHLLAYELGDLEEVDCLPPVVNGVTVDNSTELRIEFNRALDPASVATDGSQFAFSGSDGSAITATSAVVSGRFLTLTTTPQDAQVYYIATVDPSLRDVFGKSLAEGTGIGFDGGRTRASLRINEIKTNITPGCHLLELRVVDAGNLSDFDIRVQNSTVLTFGNVTVARDDLVVVHFDSNDGICRRSGSANETQAPDQQPRSSFPANFDTAFDWYSTSQGPPSGASVVAVRDDFDRILDAVLLTDNSTTSTSSQTENAAALVVLEDQWQRPGGGVPAGGFVDSAFHANAVTGIDADPVNVTPGFDELDGARSVQRDDDGDSNQRSDWTTAVHSFGALNTGQSPL